MEPKLFNKCHHQIPEYEALQLRTLEPSSIRGCVPSELVATGDDTGVGSLFSQVPQTELFW